MTSNERVFVVAAALLAVALAGRAEGVTAADKCRAAKLNVTGKYAYCRLKAEANGVKRGVPPNYTRCDAKFARTFSAAETQAGDMCATKGDLAGVQGQVIAETTKLKMLQARFVDNGDGTVSDTQTGLMWEQKTDDSSLHDKDNQYAWSSSGTSPNGSVFTIFLSGLNDCTSDFGAAITGGFAGHCDWRLPTIDELRTIVDFTAPGCFYTDPCIDTTAFGPTLPHFYWTSTMYQGDPSYAFDVLFLSGAVYADSKTTNWFHARAVRGGS